MLYPNLRRHSYSCRNAFCPYRRKHFKSIHNVFLLLFCTKQNISSLYETATNATINSGALFASHANARGKQVPAFVATLAIRKKFIHVIIVAVILYTKHSSTAQPVLLYVNRNPCGRYELPLWSRLAFCKVGMG
jgi:hypothetical protein